MGCGFKSCLWDLAVVSLGRPHNHQAHTASPAAHLGRWEDSVTHDWRLAVGLAQSRVATTVSPRMEVRSLLRGRQRWAEELGEGISREERLVGRPAKGTSPGTAALLRTRPSPSQSHQGQQELLHHSSRSTKVT